MQPVPVRVAHGQRGLAAICYLHQYVLVGEDLPPLCGTTDAEKNKETLEGDSFSVQAIDPQDGIPSTSQA